MVGASVGGHWCSHFCLGQLASSLAWNVSRNIGCNGGHYELATKDAVVREGVLDGVDRVHAFR